MSRRAGAQLLAAAGLLGACLGLWASMRTGRELPGDLRAITTARANPPRGAYSELLALVGTVGTALVALLTVATATIIVARSIGLRAAALVAGAAAGAVINDGLRALLEPTPVALLAFGPTVDSYPSGHVVYAVTVFGALAWLAWHHGRRDVSVVLLVLIAAMGPARVLTGSHLPSDVLGAYALGGAWLLVVLAAHGSGSGPHVRASRHRATCSTVDPSLLRSEAETT